MRSFLAVLSGLIVFVAWGYTVVTNPNNQWAIISMPLVAVIVGFLVYHMENIASIGAEIKGAKFYFDMKRAKKEYSARAEALTELGEGIAELLSSEISQRGRFIDADTFEYELLDKRDLIGKLLKKLGSNAEIVQEIVAPIEEAVLFDLKHKLFAVVDKNRQFRTDEPEKRPDVVHAKIEEIIDTSKVDMLLENLTPYLEELGVGAEIVRREVVDLEKFQSTKML